MSHKQEIVYKVCVYDDSYSDKVTVIGHFRKYEKAKEVLSDYLRCNDRVTRAYIEKACSYRNDKRNQWLWKLN